jgi:hypothetical protein
MCAISSTFIISFVFRDILKMDTNLQNTEQNNTYHETAERVNVFTCNAMSR